MDFTLLLKKGLKKHKFSLIGIFILLFLISFSFLSVLTIYVNSGNYVKNEMKRVGFGDFTAWVNTTAQTKDLVNEIKQVDSVKQVTTQPLVFASYEIGNQKSDDEGELLPYQPSNFKYKILKNELRGYQSDKMIELGEIYISPAMKSSFDIKVGDTIEFDVSRNQDPKKFKVAGYFEDPFMGSSMIDRKTFLISEHDYTQLSDQISKISDFDVLAKRGAMLHIFKKENVNLPVSEFNTQINEQTDLGKYTEFVYTNDSIYRFMLILQNILIGFFSAFVLVLLIISMIIIGHSIKGLIQAEYKDLGILKTLGLSSMTLRKIQIVQYMIGACSGILVGFFVSLILARQLSMQMVTSTGLLVPSHLPVLYTALFIVVMLAVLIIYLYFRTKKITTIKPMNAILGMSENKKTKDRKIPKLTGKYLEFILPIRQIVSGMGRYIGLLVISILLVFFVTVVGRLNDWVGPNGEGLMNAFSVAKHDLGVQPMKEVDMQAIESEIKSYSQIERTYQIAIQDVTVNGVNYTANVLDKPEFFHVLSGKRATKNDEVMLTKMVSDDLGVKQGESVLITHDGVSATYKVTGIYECANGMGANIGMTKEGYAKIGDVNGYIWCHHYVLKNSNLEKNTKIMQAIQDQYKTEVAVHTNSWSGLSGIVSTLHMIVIGMYAIVLIFILVVVSFLSNQMIYAEQNDMAIFKSIGFTSSKLRVLFALRFAIVAFLGAIIGVIISSIFVNPVINVLLQKFGIGEFGSAFHFMNTIAPAFGVVILFFLFAYVVSRKMKSISCIDILSQN